MKYFLKAILIDPFTDSDSEWPEYLFGSVMWLITILIVGGLLWLSGWFVDSSFLPINQKQGTVTHHYYVPAHTTTTYHYIGKVMVPSTTYVPDRYVVTIEIDGLSDDVYLQKSYWNETTIGDKLCCEYTNGRLFRTLYVQSFCGHEK